MAIFSTLQYPTIVPYKILLWTFQFSVSAGHLVPVSRRQMELWVIYCYYNCPTRSVPFLCLTIIRVLGLTGK